MSFTVTDLVMYGLRAVLVLVFLVVGWREVAMLFRRPARNMGTGMNRAWSVAHTTMLEAWAGRVWILPVLWFISAILLIAVVRPFDESERMPLDIRMLFSAQEILLLVMIGVMACLSLPRERERKILITNASKPLSRLEIVLGKMLGFSAVAGLMLLVLGAGTWAILGVEDWRIRRQAADTYELQKADYLKKSEARAPGDVAIPPSESLRRLSEEGALFAYNYIAVPKENLSVVGYIDLQATPPVRYIKGGSLEKAVYVFPALVAPTAVVLGGAGTRPYFTFDFPVLVPPGMPDPQVVQLYVSAKCQSRRVPPPKPVEKLVTLRGNGQGAWEPDDPTEIYSLINTMTGELEVSQGDVAVEVSCSTPGVYLQVHDGAMPDERGVVPDTAQFNVKFIPNRENPNQVLVPLPDPVMRGFERRDRMDVSGPTSRDVRTKEGGVMLESAVFRFPGASLENVPVVDGKFKLAANLETYKTENIDAPTRARITVRSFDRRGVKQPWSTEIEVAEKRLTVFDVPAEELGNVDPKKRGDLVIQVACVTPEHSISVLPESLRLELPQTAFVINLLKSEAVLLLEAMLLIAICVTCSVRVGWPVAMLLAAVCVTFGYFVQFIAELQEYGGLGALNYRVTANSSATFHFFDRLAGGVWSVLGVIASFVPQFTVYKPQDWIANLQDMPWGILWEQAAWTVVFLVPCIAIAHLLFRKQEIG